ncbi:MAG TPA: transketolase [Desulfobacterales bacterium]|nr:transketolase [Desulfobacterales bacterium]
MGRVDRATGIESHLPAEKLRSRAARMRALDLVSIHAAGSGHPGGTLSVMDIAAVLFLDEVRYDPADPRWEGRDRVFFSAGHKAPALYVALVEAGYLGEEQAVTLRKLGSPCQGHPHAPALPGVEVSSGSLGQGLGIAAGCALAGRMAGAAWRVYCIMGDGEQQEGSIWEAAMAAAHHRLDNLCCIVDKNRLQIDGPVSAVMGIDPLADKYRAFGWNVLAVDGHDVAKLQEAFRAARAAKGRPTAIIADTVKGKGVSFMENQAGWHGMATKGLEQLDQALREIGSPSCTPEHARKLLAAADGFQKRAEVALAGELPRHGHDWWWNAGTDLKVEMVPTRTGFGACLAKHGDDPRLVTVHADISSSISIADFEKSRPERLSRVVSVGIAEQNMMSVAAGLALEGKIPIAGTYGVFAAGRPWDQIRTTICYDKLNVKIAGAHGGISVGADGATHQALEEISLMAVLPNMTVVVPCDSVETERLARAAIFDVHGPVYIRYAREATPVVTGETTPLELGTANVIRYRGRRSSFRDAFETVLAGAYEGEGEDLAIAACGPILCEAMRAAVILKEEYALETRVLNLHTVKPLDVEALRRAARETGVVLTCEEHQKGGFGNLVAGAVCGCEMSGRPFAFDRLGVEDRFGESGKPWELMVRFGLTAEHIAARAKALVASRAHGEET